MLALSVLLVRYMPSNCCRKQENKDTVDDDDSEGQTRDHTNVALFVRGHLRQRCAGRLAVHACAFVSSVGAVAGVSFVFDRMHILKSWLTRPWEVDLEWAAQQALLTQESEKLCIILCSTSNEGHCLTIGSAELDIFSAVEEAAAIYITPEIVELCNQPLAALWNYLRDIDEK